MDNINGILRKNNFTFNKGFGQNFITDEILLNELVEKAGVTKEDVVLEIGCGAGTLTKVLSNNAKKVVGYEIDLRLKPILSETLSDCKNVEIVYKDFLKERLSDLEKRLGDKYILVANLPYYITTPIVTRFLENDSQVKSMIIMVQEEVAERFCAKNGTSEYGAITVAVNLRGNAKIITKVNRNMFTPVPNVDSAVVKIDLDREKNKNVDLVKVRDVVRCAFSSRRKMLVNNLMNTYKIDRVFAENILKSCDISITSRGEVLSSEEFIVLEQQLDLIGAFNGKNM